MAVVAANEVACVVLDVEWNEYVVIRGEECKCCCGAIGCFCIGSSLAPGMLTDCGGGGKGGCMRWYECGTERSGNRMNREIHGKECKCCYDAIG